MLSPKLFRALIGFVTLLAAASLTVVFAAGLGIRGDLGAGDATVAECDDSFAYSFTTSGGKVTQVTVSDIAPACVGGKLSVTLTDPAAAAIGDGGPVTVSETSSNVTMSLQADAAQVAGIEIVVIGP